MKKTPKKRVKDSFDTAEEEEVLYAWGRLHKPLVIFECFPQALHKWAISFAATQINAIAKKSKETWRKRRLPNANSQELDNEALQHVCLGVLCDGVEWMKSEGSMAFGQELIDACLTSLERS